MMKSTYTRCKNCRLKPEELPGVQPERKAYSEVALDGGKHRAILDAGDGDAQYSMFGKAQDQEKKLK